MLGIDCLVWLLRMSKWQPIETAPKDGTYIAAYEWRGSLDYPEMEQIYTAWYAPSHSTPGYWLQYNGTTLLKAHPTHWMPLPKPPTRNQGN